MSTLVVEFRDQGCCIFLTKPTIIYLLYWLKEFRLSWGLTCFNKVTNAVPMHNVLERALDRAMKLHQYAITIIGQSAFDLH